MPVISMNDAQLEAVHTIEGPVIIISCPGSGKTTTLIHRVRFMIECRIDPASILTVTFTNAAAERMKHYYQKVFGREDRLQFLTIHSLCFGILRAEGLYCPGDILKEDERRRFVYQQVSRMTWVNDPWELTGALLTDFSVVRNNDIDPDTYEPEACPARTFREVLRLYDEYRDRDHKIDFDDMLIQCRELLRDPEILSKWQRRFQYIQCDEYQDTNGLQRDILYMLAGEKKNLCVVGDDDQSIYMFRGARPEIMLRFEEDFPGCRVIHLSVNYRSGRAVVERAGMVIAHNRARYQKDFLSARGEKGFEGAVHCQKFDGRAEEMDYVITCIREAVGKGVPCREMAVLFRTGRQAQLPAAALSRAGIPAFSTESVRSIYEGWVFEGIRAYVKLSLGQAGPDAMLYVLNRPSRYLKEEYFRTCSYSLSSMLRAASYLKRDASWKYEAARESLTAWMKAFGPAVLRPTDEPYLVFQALKSETGGIGYDLYIRSYAEYRKLDAEELLGDFAQMEADAASFRTIQDWLDFAEASAAASRSSGRPRDPQGVVLTTMHKAKGLEWQYVFLIDVNKDLVPHRNAETALETEEERRLFYVAMTRAKDVLYILGSGKASSFMQEMEDDLRKEEALAFWGIWQEKQGINVFVRHSAWGLGRVLSMKEGKKGMYLRVDFDGMVKTFPYPKAFADGHLCAAKGLLD